MSEFKRTELELDHRFDPRSCRHSLNGFVSVLHCHHYVALYTQLAIDAKETELLAGVSEETFYKVLQNYMRDHGVITLPESIDLSAQYFSALGLGKMEVVFAGDFSGEVKLLKSHVDEGWIKKWGKFDQPINYITAGFIAAMFTLWFDMPLHTYRVVEKRSIVMGDPVSLFQIEKK